MRGFSQPSTDFALASILPEDEVVADVVAEVLVGLRRPPSAAPVAPEGGGGGGGARGGVAALERLVVGAGGEGCADGADVVVVEEAAPVAVLHRPVLQGVGRGRDGSRAGENKMCVKYSTCIKTGIALLIRPILINFGETGMVHMIRQCCYFAATVISFTPKGEADLVKGNPRSFPQPGCGPASPTRVTAEWMGFNLPL